jgi:hypothetical protein
MTSMPAPGALRPRDDLPGAASPFAAFDPTLYAFDERCTVLIGWQQREAVLRMITTTRAVIGGVAGLRPGDRMRLVLHRGRAVMRDCIVTGSTLSGVELEHAEVALSA